MSRETRSAEWPASKLPSRSPTTGHLAGHFPPAISGLNVRRPWARHMRLSGLLTLPTEEQCGLAGITSTHGRLLRSRISRRPRGHRLFRCDTREGRNSSKRRPVLPRFHQGDWSAWRDCGWESTLHWVRLRRPAEASSLSGGIRPRLQFLSRRHRPFGRESFLSWHRRIRPDGHYPMPCGFCLPHTVTGRVSRAS